jgi:hypothetical protein
MQLLYNVCLLCIRLIKSPHDTDLSLSHEYELWIDYVGVSDSFDPS